MARVSQNDPLEKFRFGITWGQLTSKNATAANGAIDLNINGVNVAIAAASPKAGFHDIQMPKRTTNKIMYREGTDPDVSSLSAGLSTMEDIVLKRGLLSSVTTMNELVDWASLVHAGGAQLGPYPSDPSGVSTGSGSYRQDVTIWMYDRTGAVARAWQLINAWPTHFVPGSDLNAAEDGEKSLEEMTLAYEDFYELKVVGATSSNGASAITTQPEI